VQEKKNWIRTAKEERPMTNNGCSQPKRAEKGYKVCSRSREPRIGLGVTMLPRYGGDRELSRPRDRGQPSEGHEHGLMRLMNGEIFMRGEGPEKGTRSPAICAKRPYSHVVMDTCCVRKVVEDTLAGCSSKGPSEQN